MNVFMEPHFQHSSPPWISISCLSDPNILPGESEHQYAWSLSCHSKAEQGLTRPSIRFIIPFWNAQHSYDNLKICKCTCHIHAISKRTSNCSVYVLIFVVLFAVHRALRSPPQPRKFCGWGGGIRGARDHGRRQRCYDRTNRLCSRHEIVSLRGQNTDCA